MALTALVAAGASDEAAGRGEEDGRASSAWLASGVLSSMLHNNADVKRMLLRLPTAAATGTEDDGAVAAAPAPSDAMADLLFFQWLVKHAIRLSRASTGAPPLLGLSFLQVCASHATASGPVFGPVFGPAFGPAFALGAAAAAAGYAAGYAFLRNLWIGLCDQHRAWRRKQSGVGPRAHAWHVHFLFMCRRCGFVQVTTHPL